MFRPLLIDCILIKTTSPFLVPLSLSQTFPSLKLLLSPHICIFLVHPVKTSVALLADPSAHIEKCVRFLFCFHPKGIFLPPLFFGAGRQDCWLWYGLSLASMIGQKISSTISNLDPGLASCDPMPRTCSHARNSNRLYLTFACATCSVVRLSQTL